MAHRCAFREFAFHTARAISPATGMKLDISKCTVRPRQYARRKGVGVPDRHSP